MTKRKIRLQTAIILPAVFFLCFSIFKYPVECTRCVDETLKTLYNSVIPILFPFMTISEILTVLRMTGHIEKTVGRLFKKLYRIPQCVSGAFALGALSSYPIGAVTVTELYKDGSLTRNEAETAAALASVTGPSFPAAVVGTLFLGNGRTGWLIYLVQLFVPLVLGVPFCRFFCKKRTGASRIKKEKKQADVLSVITEAVSSSSIRCVAVCGTVVIFTLFSERLIALTGVTGTAKAIINSLFEFSGGCRSASLLPGALGTGICAFSVSFGGLSVIVQSAAAMKKEGLSASKLAVFKFVCGTISGAVVSSLTYIFDIFEPSVSAVRAFSYVGGPDLLHAAALIALFSGIILRIRYLILRSR